MTKKAQDLTGLKFGMLTVVSRAPNQNGQPMWYCKCDCGNVVTMRGYKIRTGKDVDCGCRKSAKLSVSNRKHGYFGTPTYASWMNMKQYCSNTTSHIPMSYCKAWQNFEDFLADMGERPAGTLLQRIDISRDFEPGNCVWELKTELDRNKKGFKYLIRNGERKTILEWAKSMDIPILIFHQRLSSGQFDDYFDNL